MGRYVRLTVRLDPQRDADLIQALARARAEGLVLNRLVRDALRRYFADEVDEQPCRGREADGTDATPRIGAGADFWDELRRVVEASVASALAQVSLRVEGTDAADDEQARAEAVLDALGGALDLDDEEW